MGGINMPEDQKISRLVKGMAEDLYQVLIKSEKKSRKYFLATCINDVSSNSESIIREKVQSNLTPLTREKPAPSLYRTKMTGESSWRPRPQQVNRPTQQETGKKTDLWPQQVKEGNWTSTNDGILTEFLIMAAVLNLTTSVRKANHRIVDAIHNAVKQDLPLVAHLLGPVVNALVDSGADYSVVSKQLSTQLLMPMFLEHNPILRTACGKDVKAIGRCMLRVNLNGVEQTFEFSVFQQCSHDLILG
ncbi:CCHC-type domain-containing protein [Trichonephila clavipes]|nr:CCHC-type domain-containing protein [Trichonephila clavipes]